MTAALAFVVAAVTVAALLVGPQGAPVRARAPLTAGVPSPDRPTRTRLAEAIRQRPLAGPLRTGQKRKQDEQLPAALERVAAGIRSGQALPAALLAVAADTPAPLGQELARRTAGLGQGAGLSGAMEEWAADPEASPSERLAGTALAIGATTGGEVARALDQVAGSLRQSLQVQAEARALSSQARASALLLAVAPFAFTALVATVEPDVVVFLVTTAPGIACLISGLGLQLAGAKWMARIVGEER